VTETPEQIHDRLLAPIVASILWPLTQAGAETSDVLSLLESVAAGVLGIAVLPAGDASVLKVYTDNVRRKLRLLRRYAFQRSD
jgi:hypothetical protein